MDSRQGSRLKRRFVRVRMSVVALVHVGAGHAHPVTVENLSASGALLVGPEPLPVGQCVKVDMVLDRRRFASLPALVTRVEQSRGAVAVAVQFKDLAPEVEKALAAAVMDTVERARAESPTAIVIAAVQGKDIQALVRSVQAHGIQPLVVATFLDALRWLQDAQLNVEALIVDLEGGIGREALRWCAEAFPRVRRVLMATAADTIELLSRQSSVLPDAVLVSPVEPRSVPAALGLSSAPTLISVAPSSPPPAV